MRHTAKQPSESDEDAETLYFCPGYLGYDSSDLLSILPICRLMNSQHLPARDPPRSKNIEDTVGMGHGVRQLIKKRDYIVFKLALI